MAQEKQKVIRVLKPAQKKKDLSPIYYGIAGVTFGIAVTCVLVFSVLGDDSKKNQVVADPSNSMMNETNQVNSQHDPRPATLATNNNAETLDDNADDYGQPQTKIKDLPNAFKQDKQIVADQVNQNPFANATGQNKTKKTVTANPALTIKKPPVTAQTVKAKPATEKTTLTKVAQPTAKPETVTVAKAKSVENDNDVELPKATVQISVTRSVKE